MTRMKPEHAARMRQVGLRVKEARERKGLKATGLDKLAKIGRGAVSRIEAGKRLEVSMETLAKIAKVLDVTLDWLAGREQPEREPTIAELKGYLLIRSKDVRERIRNLADDEFDKALAKEMFEVWLLGASA